VIDAVKALGLENVIENATSATSTAVRLDAVNVRAVSR
jgi:hypothetical protein